MILPYRAMTNIYDVNWLRQGNKMITPGVERVDTVKTEDGYEMKSIWCRSDLSDTSMMKLIYGNRIYLRICSGSGNRYVAVYHT